MTFAVPTLAALLPIGLRREMAARFGCIERYGRQEGWAVRFEVEGKVYRIVSIPFGARWLPIRTREDAEGILEEIRYGIRKHGDVIAAIGPYMARSKLLGVERRWTEWVEILKARESAGQLSKKRREELEGHLSRGHLDAIRERPIHALDYAALEELQAALFRRKLAPKSVHHVLADVRTFLRWAARRGWIQAVPEIPATLLEEYAPTIPSQAEQQQRIDAIPAEERGYFLARGLLGVRHQEAVRAELVDYRRGPWDEDRGLWLDDLIVRGKGRTFRILPVPAALSFWVREHRPTLAEAGAPLFPDPKTGRRVAPKWHERRWRAMERRLKLPHIKPNEALRHCFGTRRVEKMLADGASLEEARAAVKRVMGHVSDKTSARYIKLAPETLRDAIGGHRPSHQPPTGAKSEDIPQ